MTNLEKAGSLRRALETYPKPSELLNFKKWCTQEATPTIPDWVKAGQWIQDTTTKSCFKIKQVYETGVYYTNGGIDPTTLFAKTIQDYHPITIKPWTFAEADAVMAANTLISLKGYPVTIRRIVKHITGVFYLHNSLGDAHNVDYYALHGITYDHKPCGTPVPL